ncbi:MAG: hypothetical protein HY717_18770 [Planctomycetes bacterium]|nr:hypothetical protein [Planctomycetota bacterium]
MMISICWSSSWPRARRISRTRPARRKRLASWWAPPGFRYALNLPKDIQIVLGAAAPLGLTDETEDYGVFAYFSFESPLWKE